MLKKFLIQWHITENCNQRCLHCYQDDYSSEDLNIDILKKFFNEFLKLIKYLNQSENNYWLHINFTGGEPFVRNDFLELLEYCKNQYNNLSFGILTNGALLDENAINVLNNLKVAFVQLSLEGNKQIHDKIRGKNNYFIVKTAAKLLVKNKIKTYLSFTAHKNNYNAFKDVAKTARKLKVNKLWADRFVPFGTGTDMKELVLTAKDNLKFMQIMNKEKQKLKFFSNTEVSMNRALHFQETGHYPYKCSAGNSLITVLHNGDVLPCRRLPIKAGNLLTDSLINIYKNSKILTELRNSKQQITGCESCSYQEFCLGGAKCMAYALKKDYFSGDPGCKYLIS